MSAIHLAEVVMGIVLNLQMSVRRVAILAVLSCWACPDGTSVRPSASLSASMAFSLQGLHFLKLFLNIFVFLMLL